METKENIAKVNGMNLPISRKKSVEVCNLLRNKTTKTAKIILKRVMKLEQAVPYRRYTQDKDSIANNWSRDEGYPCSNERFN